MTYAENTRKKSTCDMNHSQKDRGNGILGTLFADRVLQDGRLTTDKKGMRMNAVGRLGARSICRASSSYRRLRKIILLQATFRKA